jgi:hypothetical protein
MLAISPARPPWPGHPTHRPRTTVVGVTNRQKILLAGALAALAMSGCSTSSTDDTMAGETTAAGSSMTAASEASAPAVSEAMQKQAQTLAEEAEKIMLDPTLAPREKYPKSLGMFRDALEIDPNNALAKDGIKLIEDIYTSMGRPVPEPT